jgi:acyl carrier protein
VSNTVDVQAIRAWLVRHLAKVLNVDGSSIDPQMRFGELGLDSTAAVTLTGELSDWLDADLEPDMALVHNSIDALAERLVDRLARGPA